MGELQPIDVVFVGAVATVLSACGLLRAWYGALAVGVLTLAAGLVWAVVSS